jgi:hypothetical protein
MGLEHDRHNQRRFEVEVIAGRREAQFRVDSWSSKGDSRGKRL